MSIKIMLIAAVGGISLATSTLAFPVSPLRSGSSVVEARTVCDVYGRCSAEAYPTSPAAQRFEGRSVYMHKGYLYDPMSGRHYDRDRGRWVTDVGTRPTK